MTTGIGELVVPIVRTVMVLPAWYLSLWLRHPVLGGASTAGLLLGIIGLIVLVVRHGQTHIEERRHKRLLGTGGRRARTP
jgi:hypothetical protein